MKPRVLQEKYNPYTKRKEIALEIEHKAAATPSCKQMQELVAAEYNAQPEQVDVRLVDTLDGLQLSHVNVFIWDEPKVHDLSKSAEEKKENTEAAPIAAPA